MNTIDYKIPKHVTDQNILDRKHEENGHKTTANQTAKCDFYIKLVMLFLLLVQKESNKHFNSIKFIYEQLNLMKQNKFDYLVEMSLSSLLYTGCYVIAKI